MAAEKIKIVLADDHEALRADTRALLDRQPDMMVIGEASNGQVAIEITESLMPDIVLMDITMPGMDGLEATRRIRMSRSPVAVLILSCHDEPGMVEAGRQAGAAGYLLKSTRSRQLLHAIRSVYHGQTLW